jgi:hypothetical protein
MSATNANAISLSFLGREFFLSDLAAEWATFSVSKEKNRQERSISACCQSMGIGKVVIQLLYVFRKIAWHPGKREKRLSDRRSANYHECWKDAVLDAILLHRDEAISVIAISGRTSMMDADVKFALRGGGYLKGVMGKWVEKWESRFRLTKIRLQPLSRRFQQTHWPDSFFEQKKYERELRSPMFFRAHPG